MATIVKLKSGNYRVQIRRDGQYACKTFLRKASAQAWDIGAPDTHAEDCPEIINSSSMTRT